MKENISEKIDNQEQIVKQIVGEYLRLGEKIENPPNVVLKAKTQSLERIVGARDIAVSTAFQCYSSGITELKVRDDEKSEATAESTLEAGHLTTRQHDYYTWKIIGATRSVVHDTLHFHSFYNTSQQSQRYVEAKEGNYFVPTELTTEQKTFYLEAANYSNQAYFKMMELLSPEVEKRLKSIYPESAWSNQNLKLPDKAKKMCQEIARYVLPIGQHTNLDHTLSEVQLIRLFRASKEYNFSDEARYLIGSMVSEVAKTDPTIWKELRVPMEPGEKPEFDLEEVRDQVRRFEYHNNFIDSPDATENSKLVGRQDELIHYLLADSVRNVLGRQHLSDREALDLLFNPAKNHYLADVFATGMLDPLTSTLRLVNLTFATKISHTGDSQRQRQRMTPGITPCIEALYSGKADYVTPMIVRGGRDILKDYYHRYIRQEFRNVGKAISLGIPEEYALLLLPNALTIRLYETGDLFDWFVRWKERLCNCAQEEIFFTSVEQVNQVLDVLPEARPILQAKCGVRRLSGIRPYCPEGTRFCGVDVYNSKIEDYKGRRII